jgi:hypothetical protein
MSTILEWASHWHACHTHGWVEWGVSGCCREGERNLIRTHMPNHAQRAWAKRVDAEARVQALRERHAREWARWGANTRSATRDARENPS